MKLIDLTHIIEKDMPLYPDTPAPEFVGIHSLAKDGFCETQLMLTSHTGTHIDTPRHMYTNGAGIEDIPLENYFGLACIVDVTAATDRSIGMEYFRPYQDKLPFCNFVIFRTGWDKLWGKEGYFTGYPYLKKDAAEYLAALSHLKGVGIDAISFDHEDDMEYTKHKILLGAGKILIENLCGLEQLEAELVMLSVLPLRYRDGDGSPVRAVAFESPLV